MKKTILIPAAALCLALMLGGCGKAPQEASLPSAVEEEQESSVETAPEEADAETTSEAGEIELADGKYWVTFDTDSSMFHINEAYEGRGILTVENGNGVVHITLPSKKIVTLYAGLAEDAVEDEANQLQPTTDCVTYSDGDTDEVYGFDIPVKALDQEFDVALIGTHGNWYDHKVVISDPQPYEE